MVFNIATTNSSLSLERQADLVRLLNTHSIPYRLYTGEITPLKYDGLYNTAKQIIQDHIEEPYVIFAEDDLVLTEAFSIENLENYIDRLRH
ncbi:hypothetical protein [Pedobacter sp. NJ-S-72]